MSTRALIHIYEDDVLLCTLYRHSDGYPDGHGVGKELVAIVAKHPITNGQGSSDPPNAINGAGRMASHIIRSIERLDLRAPHADDCGEEYVYKVYLPGFQQVDAAEQKPGSNVSRHVFGYVQTFEVAYWKNDEGRARYDIPGYLVPYEPKVKS